MTFTTFKHIFFKFLLFNAQVTKIIASRHTVCIQNTSGVYTEYDGELLNLLNYFLGTHISLKGLFGSLYSAIFTFQFLNLASPWLPLHYGIANYTLDAHYMNAIDRLITQYFMKTARSDILFI